MVNPSNNAMGTQNEPPDFELPFKNRSEAQPPNDVGCPAHRLERADLVVRGAVRCGAFIHRFYSGIELMSPCHCSTSHPFIVVGDAQQIGALLCGPQQADDHCKAWRWREYVQHDKKRIDNVMAEVRAIAAERRANLTSQQRADIELAHWQLLRVRA
jgi:hypothetical protein